MKSAQDTCACIFFTSATCPPCKTVYPAYDDLAASAGKKAVLIKVDVGEAFDIGSRYQVRATPTFITFLRGEKENEWSGASESQLRGNVGLLIQMAHPEHPHLQLRVPTFARPHTKPVTYPKVPPLDKLKAKLGLAGEEPSIKALTAFNKVRAESGAVDAPLPSLPDISSFIVRAMSSLPVDTLFPLVDLFRLAVIDPRVSGYLIRDSSSILAIFSKTSELGEKCPYQLRIVTLHLACNLFTSHLFIPALLKDETLSTLLLQLATTSLLDEEHHQVRVVAAQVAFNAAAFNHTLRLDHQPEVIPEAGQVELMASLLEAMRKEESSTDAMRGLYLAIGLLKYLAPVGGELTDLCEAVGAKDLVTDTKGRFAELNETVKELEMIMT